MISLPSAVDTPWRFTHLKTSHFQARTALPGNIQPRLAIDN
jgi:hypothetical protein